jgi:hypothetical protein
MWPAFELHRRADGIGGAIRAAGNGTMIVEVRQTSGMTNRPIKVTGKDEIAIEFTRTADTVIFTLPLRVGERSPWQIQAL